MLQCCCNDDCEGHIVYSSANTWKFVGNVSGTSWRHTSVNQTVYARSVSFYGTKIHKDFNAGTATVSWLSKLDITRHEAEPLAIVGSYYVWPMSPADPVPYTSETHELARDLGGRMFIRFYKLEVHSSNYDFDPKDHTPFYEQTFGIDEWDSYMLNIKGLNQIYCFNSPTVNVNGDDPERLFLEIGYIMPLVLDDNEVPLVDQLTKETLHRQLTPFVALGVMYNTDYAAFSPGSPEAPRTDVWKGKIPETTSGDEFEIKLIYSWGTGWDRDRIGYYTPAFPGYWYRPGPVYTNLRPGESFEDIAERTERLGQQKRDIQRLMLSQCTHMLGASQVDSKVAKFEVFFTPKGGQAKLKAYEFVMDGEGLDAYDRDTRLIEDTVPWAAGFFEEEYEIRVTYSPLASLVGIVFCPQTTCIQKAANAAYGNNATVLGFEVELEGKDYEGHIKNAGYELYEFRQWAAEGILGSPYSDCINDFYLTDIKDVSYTEARTTRYGSLGYQLVTTPEPKTYYFTTALGNKSLDGMGIDPGASYWTVKQITHRDEQCNLVPNIKYGWVKEKAIFGWKIKHVGTFHFQSKIKFPGSEYSGKYYLSLNSNIRPNWDSGNDNVYYYGSPDHLCGDDAEDIVELGPNDKIGTRHSLITNGDLGQKSANSPLTGVAARSVQDPSDNRWSPCGGFMSGDRGDRHLYTPTDPENKDGAPWVSRDEIPQTKHIVQIRNADGDNEYYEPNQYLNYHYSDMPARPGFEMGIVPNEIVRLDGPQGSNGCDIFFNFPYYFGTKANGDPQVPDSCKSLDADNVWDWSTLSSQAGRSWGIQINIGGGLPYSNKTELRPSLTLLDGTTFWSTPTVNSLPNGRVQAEYYALTGKKFNPSTWCVTNLPYSGFVHGEHLGSSQMTNYYCVVQTAGKGKKRVIGRDHRSKISGYTTDEYTFDYSPRPDGEISNWRDVYYTPAVGQREVYEHKEHFITLQDLFGSSKSPSSSMTFTPFQNRTRWGWGGMLSSFLDYNASPTYPLDRKNIHQYDGPSFPEFATTMFPVRFRPAYHSGTFIRYTSNIKSWWRDYFKAMFHEANAPGFAAWDSLDPEKDPRDNFDIVNNTFNVSKTHAYWKDRVCDHLFGSDTSLRRLLADDLLTCIRGASRQAFRYLHHVGTCPYQLATMVRKDEPPERVWDRENFQFYYGNLFYGGYGFHGSIGKAGVFKNTTWGFDWTDGSPSIPAAIDHPIDPSGMADDLGSWYNNSFFYQGGFSWAVCNMLPPQGEATYNTWGLWSSTELVLWALLAADMIDRDLLAADVPNPIPWNNFAVADPVNGRSFQAKGNKSLYLANFGASNPEDIYRNANALFDNHQVTDYPAAWYNYTGGGWYYNHSNARTDSGDYHAPSFQKAGLETEMYRYPWIPEMSSRNQNPSLGIQDGQGPPEFGAGTTNRWNSTWYGLNYRNFSRYVHAVGNPYTEGFFNGWLDEAYEESGEWIMKIKSIKPVFGPEPELELS